MLFANAPAIEHDRVAHRVGRVRALRDCPCEIDARNHGKAANDRALTRDRKTVLVIQRAVADIDEHVAFRQARFVDFGNAGFIRSGFLINKYGLEHDASCS